MQSPFPHSNSSCTLQVEFRAGEGVGNVSSAGLSLASPPLPIPTSSRFHLPSTFAGEILLQDALAAAGAVDVSFGSEETEILTAAVVHPARGQLT